MKITEELIDKILAEGENGSLDPSPYMESLKYLLMEDDEVDLTEEDHAYLIFLGTITLESLKRNGLYKEIDDEEILFDMEDANWDALEEADGDLDVFIDAVGEDYPEQDLLERHEADRQRSAHSATGCSRAYSFDSARKR